ncbi:hypothetical protein SLE2022_276420 [Rubroshorea leprosula]
MFKHRRFIIFWYYFSVPVQHYEVYCLTLLDANIFLVCHCSLQSLIPCCLVLVNVSYIHSDQSEWVGPGDTFVWLCGMQSPAMALEMEVCILLLNIVYWSALAT